MQLTEIALSTALAGGIAGTAKVAQAYVAPHAGLIAGVAAGAGIAAGAGYGAYQLGEHTVTPAASERAKVHPNISSNGAVLGGSIVAGVLTAMMVPPLIDRGLGASAHTRVALAFTAAGLGAATIASLVGMEVGKHRENAAVATWRAAHPDQVETPPPPPAPKPPKPAFDSGGLPTQQVADAVDTMLDGDSNEKAGLDILRGSKTQRNEADTSTLVKAVDGAFSGDSDELAGLKVAAASPRPAADQARILAALSTMLDSGSSTRDGLEAALASSRSATDLERAIHQVDDMYSGDSSELDGLKQVL